LSTSTHAPGTCPPTVIPRHPQTFFYFPDPPFLYIANLAAHCISLPPPLPHLRHNDTLISQPQSSGFSFPSLLDSFLFLLEVASESLRRPQVFLCPKKEIRPKLHILKALPSRNSLIKFGFRVFLPTCHRALFPKKKTPPKCTPFFSSRGVAAVRPLRFSKIQSFPAARRFLFLKTLTSSSPNAALLVLTASFF